MFKEKIQKVKGFVRNNKKELLQVGLMSAIVVMPHLLNVSICGATEASTNTSMPWNSGVTSLRNELIGPLPKMAAVIAVAVSGAMMAFGEMSGMTKKAIQVVFGLGIALGSATLVSIISGTTVSGSLF